MNTWRVKAEGVTRCFGEITALNNVSFTVNHGEVFGLIGAPGSGKTTTARLLASVDRPSKGSVSHCGSQDIHRTVDSSIGYLPTGDFVCAHSTVCEHLHCTAFQKGLQGADLAVAMDWTINAFGLKDALYRQCNALARSWQRRIAFAAAAIHRPSLLVLDELTIGIDGPTCIELWNLVIDLARSGMTIIATVHFMEEAERCDRIAYLVHGQLAYCGSPSAAERRAGLAHCSANPHWCAFDCDYPVFASQVLIARRLITSTNGHTVSVLLDNLHSVDVLTKVLTANRIEHRNLHSDCAPLDAYLAAFNEEYSPANSFFETAVPNATT